MKLTLSLLTATLAGLWLYHRTRRPDDGRDLGRLESVVRAAGRTGAMEGRR